VSPATDRPLRDWLVRYRIIPRRPWRPLLILLGGAALFGEFQWSLISGFRWHPRLMDQADVLPWKEERFAERVLDEIARESGVDIRFQFVPAITGETIEQFSVRRARAIGIGRETGRRGVFFIYDVAHHQLRAEVGANLEEYLTDAFMGHLIRTNTRDFFGAGSPRDGFVSTLFMVQHRLRQATLQQSYDPRYVEYIQDVRRLALGGGASTVAPRGGDTAVFLRASAGPAERAWFAPQSTVDATFRRYLEWLALGQYQTDVPMFTIDSQEWLAGNPMTPGFMEFMLSVEYGRRYTIDERGRVAVLYFTDDPFAQPHFFRRTRQGWEMDVIAEVLNTMNLVGMPYSWSLRTTGDEYARTFADLYRPIGDLWRFVDGDNRPLPLHDRGRAEYFGDELAQIAAAEAAPVERLTVRDAVARIAATNGRPSVVILYDSDGLRDTRVFGDLARAADAWQDRGVVVLAFSTDRDPTVPGLAEFLQRHGAVFPPVNLYRWPSGTLDGSMASIGIHIGQTWDSPLVAVRDATGRVVYQAQGVSDFTAASAALRSVE